MNYIRSFLFFATYSGNTFDNHREKNTGAGGKALRNRPLLHSQPANNTLDSITNRLIINKEQLKRENQ
jgi:hypothetical protein